LLFDECDSTNRIARERAEQGAPEGDWISARVQTAGRGRQERVWESVEGNLFLSMVLRSVPIERWTWVSLLSAVAIRRALVSLDHRLGSHIQIKWPNDLWADHKKLCGILVESGGNAHGRYLVVGVGLNVSCAPQGKALMSTCVSDLGSSIGLEDVRSQVICELRALPSRMRESFEAERQEFVSHSVLQLQDEIEWFGQRGKENGYYLGVGEHGEARVKQGETIRSLFTDEISRVRRRG
jgi:biotin-[acetyl-CoA-carboxylase] ligase BirA-like protein